MFEQVVSEIEKKGKYTATPGVENIRRWMKVLGPVDEGMKIIHVAGSNGKGSTVAMAAAFLNAVGYRVGIFTSPHLQRFTERIQIWEAQQRVEIPEVDFQRLGSALLEDSRLTGGNMLDYTLMVALQYFRQEKVDVVILETGLGGALDSTNGISVVPKVSVVTSISLEHTAILGDTLEQIAREKAGILKAGTVAVMGKMPQEAAAVIRNRCRELQVPLCEIQNQDVQKSRSFGYQKRNEACAREAVRAFLRSVDPAGLRRFEEILLVRTDDGIFSVQNRVWPGRLEVVQEAHPWMMVDGAHNPEGVRELYRSLTEAFPGEKFTFVIGMLQDRNVKDMLQWMLPLAKEIYTVSPRDPRGYTAEQLAEIIRGLMAEMNSEEMNSEGSDAQEATWDGDVVPVHSCLVKEALEASQQVMGRVVVFGSLYLIGEWKDEIQK